MPGTRLKITGLYPHARYFSFNVYDNAQRPLDALADVQIAPDPGSTNPFPAGANRLATQRSYTTYVNFGAIPPVRAANTLYTGTGQNGTPNYQGSFILRVYIPDQGRDETGGVGLPTITLEQTSDGSRPAPSACSGLSKPPVPGVNQAIAASAAPPVPSQADVQGLNPPRWSKFKNLVQAGNLLLTGNPFLDDYGAVLEPAEAAGGNGAFLSNLHNAYVFTQLNRAYGDVTVTTVRAPSFPNTRPGVAIMPGGQLRYFSMCTDETASQRFIACASDDRSTVGSDGLIRYVVSPAPERPATAIAACGYTWLPYGPTSDNTLIFRHMLPDPSFAQAIQRAQPGNEAATMGDYLPSTRYLASGQALPCLPGARSGASTLAGASGTSPGLGQQPGQLGLPRAAKCLSRRRIVIHPRLVRGHRMVSLRVYIGRRLERRLSGSPRRVAVDLRGRARGTFTVTLVGRTAYGRTLREHRTYHTCVTTRHRR